MRFWTHEHCFSVNSGHFCEQLGVFPAIFGEPEEAQANSLRYKVATWVVYTKNFSATSATKFLPITR